MITVRVSASHPMPVRSEGKARRYDPEISDFWRFGSKEGGGGQNGHNMNSPALLPITDPVQNRSCPKPAHLMLSVNGMESCSTSPEKLEV